MNFKKMEGTISHESNFPTTTPHKPRAGTSQADKDNNDDVKMPGKHTIKVGVQLYMITQKFEIFYKRYPFTVFETESVYRW